MLKPLDESENDQCAAFYSGSYPSTSTPRPVFQLTYRNNKGIEDYWTYSSFQLVQQVPLMLTIIQVI